MAPPVEEMFRPDMNVPLITFANKTPVSASVLASLAKRAKNVSQRLDRVVMYALVLNALKVRCV